MQLGRGHFVRGSGPDPALPSKSASRGACHNVTFRISDSLTMQNLTLARSVSPQKRFDLSFHRCRLQTCPRHFTDSCVCSRLQPSVCLAMRHSVSKSASRLYVHPRMLWHGPLTADAGDCSLEFPWQRALSAGCSSAHQLLQSFVLVIVVKQQNFLYGFALKTHLPKPGHELQEAQCLLL